MHIENYKQLVKKFEVKEENIKHILISFVVGGTLGVIATIIYDLLLQANIPSKEATSYIIGFLIIASSLGTGIGFLDDWISKVRCGLIIPITGFAHSITASILEYKKEGTITGIGANAFKLAGSVLVYGIASATIFALLEGLLHV